MRKLDAASHRTMPWKNGGGTTTEIARAPSAPDAPGARDDFDWRVSMARVDAPGAFSRFAGVDRSIAILEGSGAGEAAITLAIAGRGAVRLDRGSPPFAFPGDVDVHCALVGGGAAAGVIDFNAMTRRGRWRHLLARLVVTTDTRLAPLGDALVVFVARGVATARAGAVAHRLQQHDALIVEGEADAVTLAAEGASALEVLAVDLWRV